MFICISLQSPKYKYTDEEENETNYHACRGKTQREKFNELVCLVLFSIIALLLQSWKCCSCTILLEFFFHSYLFSLSSQKMSTDSTRQGVSQPFHSNSEKEASQAQRKERMKGIHTWVEKDTEKQKMHITNHTHNSLACLSSERVSEAPFQGGIRERRLFRLPHTLLLRLPLRNEIRF